LSGKEQGAATLLAENVKIERALSVHQQVAAGKSIFQELTPCDITEE